VFLQFVYFVAFLDYFWGHFWVVSEFFFLSFICSDLGIDVWWFWEAVGSFWGHFDQKYLRSGPSGDIPPKKTHTASKVSPSMAHFGGQKTMEKSNGAVIVDGFMCTFLDPLFRSIFPLFFAPRSVPWRVRLCSRCGSFLGECRLRDHFWGIFGQSDPKKTPQLPKIIKHRSPNHYKWTTKKKTHSRPKSDPKSNPKRLQSTQIAKTQILAKQFKKSRAFLPYQVRKKGPKKKGSNPNYQTLKKFQSSINQHIPQTLPGPGPADCAKRLNNMGNILEYL
jgi:hypothetical protein